MEEESDDDNSNLSDVIIDDDPDHPSTETENPELITPVEDEPQNLSLYKKKKKKPKLRPKPVMDSYLYAVIYFHNEKSASRALTLDMQIFGICIKVRVSYVDRVFMTAFCIVVLTKCG